jgi:hypothetical protein
MRTFSAILTAFLLVIPSAAAQFRGPRELVVQKLTRMTWSGARHQAAAVTSQRRRAVLQPSSLCALKVLREPVFPNWIDVDSDFVYVSDGLLDLFRVPKDGGTLTTIASVGAEIGPFAMDDTTIYFITVDDDTTGSLHKVPKRGGPATLLATKLPAPIEVRVDATSVYWASLGTIVGQTLNADGSIERMAKDGTGRTILADKLNAPFTLALDATDVYFDETGLAGGNVNAGLRRVSKSGGPMTTLIDGLPVVAIATSGSDIFYSAIDVTPALFRLSKAGGPPALLIDQFFVFTVTAKDSLVYAMGFNIDGETLILAVPAAGGATRTARTTSGDSFSFALDDCAVYYTSESRLERAPR